MISAAIAFFSSKVTWLGITIGAAYLGKKYIDPVVQATEKIGTIKEHTTLLLDNLSTLADTIVKRLVGNLETILNGANVLVSQVKLSLTFLNEELKVIKECLSFFHKDFTSKHQELKTEIGELKTEVASLGNKMDRLIENNNNNIPNRIEGHGEERDLGQGAHRDHDSEGGVGLLLENNRFLSSSEPVAPIENPVVMSIENISANFPTNLRIPSVSTESAVSLLNQQNSLVSPFSNIVTRITNAVEFYQATENPVSLALPVLVNNERIFTSFESTINAIGDKDNIITRIILRATGQKILGSLVADQAKIVKLFKPHDFLEIQKTPVLEWKEQSTTVIASKITTDIIENPLSKEGLSLAVTSVVCLGDPQMYWIFKPLVSLCLSTLGGKTNAFYDENVLHEGGFTKKQLLENHLEKNPHLVTFLNEEKLTEELNNSVVVSSSSVVEAM